MVYSLTPLKDFIFENKPQKMKKIYLAKKLIKVRFNKGFLPLVILIYKVYLQLLNFKESGKELVSSVKNIRLS